MQLEFHRITSAINYTMEFYEIEKIKDHMFIFAGKDANLKYKIEWYEFVFEAHNRMESEILQIINTCNHNTHVFLFENLKDWLNDPRVASINPLTILSEIDRYNHRINQEFEIYVQQEVDKFIQRPEFKMDDGYEYEEESSFLFTKYKTKVINRKYYCILREPEFIDRYYLPDYLNMLTKLISNFKRIISKYVKLYDEGKIKSHDVVYFQSTHLINPSNEQPKLELPEAAPKKMKVNISVPQLAYLFCMLNELNPDIFDIRTKTELYKFVTDNFVTKATQKDGISMDSFKNAFTDPDKKTVEFWIEKLKKMLEGSRKKFS